MGLAAALSYTWLVRALIRANGRDSGLARAIHTDVKGNVSLGLYAAGVALAAVNAYLSYVCYAAVSVIWLIPDRRFTHTHDDESIASRKRRLAISSDRPSDATPRRPRPSPAARGVGRRASAAGRSGPDTLIAATAEPSANTGAAIVTSPSSSSPTLAA